MNPPPAELASAERPVSRRKAFTLSQMMMGSLRFHWRTHAGVVLGAMVGSAALIGALVVGDSVRESLRARALNRVGGIRVALDAGDRLFGTDLAQRLHSESGESTTSAVPPDDPSTARTLHFRGTATRQDGASRALDVHIYGASVAFWSMSPREDRRPPLERTPEGNHPPDSSTATEDTLLWLGPPPGRVRLNAALASQLNVSEGDNIVLRFPKATALSHDAVMSPRNEASVALRAVVDSIVSADEFGDFSLKAGSHPELNAFVNLGELAKLGAAVDRANMLFLGTEVGGAAKGAGPKDSEGILQWAEQRLARRWRLSDGELEVRLVPLPVSPDPAAPVPAMVEVVTRRIFLDAAVGPAASGVSNALPVLTYLANAIRAGDRLVPYSMVTAAGAPWTPPDLKDDEAIVTDWLAADLGVKAGDAIEFVYFDPEAGAQLQERTNRFTVRAVVPMRGVHGDRTLMPEFPGIAKAESTHDWDAGFPLVHRIRDQDEQYWKAHRGTPKAFVTYNAGKAMWGNRFGELTAVRYPVPAGIAATNFLGTVADNLRDRLRPSDVGLSFQLVREPALKAATTGQDFGGLFLGFSFFLVIAALLLMALMFQFGLEQRVIEIGTLLAVGFRPRVVRRLWLGEAAVLSYFGALAGVAGGILYARAMIRGLSTIWRDAVGGAPLQFHITSTTVAGGLIASILVCLLAIFFTLRRQFSRPARELLSGEIAPPRTRKPWHTGAIGIASIASALALAGWALATGRTANPGIFFGAGSLLLIGGIACASAGLTWLGGDRSQPDAGTLSPGGFAMRGTARRRSRSLAVVALIACGTFLISALGAFRLDAQRGVSDRASGTGGFALMGEATMPISQDLNSVRGIEFFGLGTNDLPGVSFVPFRVRDGDDASCLNLNRAQRPRILGVNPGMLASRRAFSFAKLEGDGSGASPWEALRVSSAIATNASASGGEIPEIPAIGDQASIQWAMGKQVGDTLDYTDERGRPFRLRIVGGVANSILQGNLVIDEAAFTRLFPGEGGYRWFLIDAPAGRVEAVSAALSRAMEDTGMAMTPAAVRLAQFNAVQNTYLSTFQILGGLGLLLGSAGLGVVVLRNLLERRGELALLVAVGFRRSRLSSMVFLEHSALLLAGLAVGVVSAAVAVVPSILTPTVELPVRSLALTLGGVLALGLLTAWVAVAMSLRRPLVAALRGE